MKRRTFVKTCVIDTVSIPMPGNADERAMLVYMCEEEKLARDVYRVMFDRWGTRVFGDFTRSEERRMAIVEDRLGHHRVPDPLMDDATGAFANTDLANTYLELVAWGMKSEKDAFMVGAYVEERDIIELQHSIEVTTHPDLLEMYARLMRGSRNHLRVFVDLLENRGYVYQAQLMHQPEVDTIAGLPIVRAGSSYSGLDLNRAAF